MQRVRKAFSSPSKSHGHKSKVCVRFEQVGANCRPLGFRDICKLNFNFLTRKIFLKSSQEIAVLLIVLTGGVVVHIPERGGRTRKQEKKHSEDDNH